jgi:hypothetical protein
MEGMSGAEDPSGAVRRAALTLMVGWDFSGDTCAGATRLRGPACPPLPHQKRSRQRPQRVDPCLRGGLLLRGSPSHRGTHPRSVNEPFEQRVGSQTIRSMHPGPSHLSDRPKASNGGAPLRIHSNAPHRIMRSRGHRDQVPNRVDPMLSTHAIDPWKARRKVPADRLARIQEGLYTILLMSPQPPSDRVAGSQISNSPTLTPRRRAVDPWRRRGGRPRPGSPHSPAGEDPSKRAGRSDGTA